jgi:hypothetical protein
MYFNNQFFYLTENFTAEIISKINENKTKEKNKDLLILLTNVITFVKLLFFFFFLIF